MTRDVLEIRPAVGHVVRAALLPYGGQELVFRLPEAVGVMAERSEDRQPPRLDASRHAAGCFSLTADGWWAHVEKDEGLCCEARTRIGANGQRIDIELGAANETQYAWESVRFAPCVAPPQPFCDPEVSRTYVVDSHGKLTALADLVDGYPYNVISVRGGPPVGPTPAMAPSWHYPDLRLADTVIVTEADDGRFSLVLSFEKASAVCTGFHGPCIHSQAMIGRLAPGERGTVRGYLALVAGDATDGLEYHRRWVSGLVEP